MLYLYVSTLGHNIDLKPETAQEKPLAHSRVICKTDTVELG